MSQGAEGRAGDPAWYAGGLRFACTQCGNCCRNQGQYAFVNLSPHDLERIPAYLGISRAEFLERWCEKSPGCHPTLRMDQPACPFLDPESRCRIYPVRPMQCRTWPFWRSNLEREVWETQVRARCPGIGSGPLHGQQVIDAEVRRTEAEFG